MFPQAQRLTRHPEAPARHTTAILACTERRGPRRRTAPRLPLARAALGEIGADHPSRLAPHESPCKLGVRAAALAPQGDGPKYAFAKSSTPSQGDGARAI